MDRKGIGYFVGGIVVGGAVAGVGVWRYSKAYFTKLKNEAIDELARYYHSKYGIEEKKEEKDIESGDKKESNVEVETVKTEYEGIADIYRTSKEERTVVNYNDISGSGKSGSNASTVKKKGKKKKPYMIDKETFEENECGYDKIFVAYYEADNTFVNEETDEVIDVLDEIGSSNLNSAEDYDGQIFVANDQIATMYMLTVEHAAWCEEGI